MQFKTIATILAVSGAALAQDFSQVPKCAVNPALATFGKTGCALTNIKCICGSTSLVPELESAIAAACSPEDLAKANAFAIETCKQAGVTLVIPGNGASASGSSSSATGSSTSSSASTTSSSSSSASTTSSTSAATTPSTSPTGSASTGAASSTPTPGAANTVKVGGSALFGAVLAALAF